MLSKACIVGIYQQKLEYIAQQGIDLFAVVPPSWRDERGEIPLERAYTQGYTLHATPIRHNGSFHFHYYPALPALLRAFKPDVVHIDEEPYNLPTWHALFHAKQMGAKTLFFTWQNINRRYPPPFRWGERYTLHNVDDAIAGTDGAAAVYREKGYTGRMAVIPQFGVDPDLFRPAQQRPPRPFTVGFVGRLVPEKGLDVLLRALAQLDGDWCARIIGGGPMGDALAQFAHQLGIGAHVEFVSQVPSAQMPALYHSLDMLVLPSLTRPNWKEQFGRALIEAMASGVPVIGSDSGAIPDVVGTAGAIVPEGDVGALAAAIHRVRDDAPYREALRNAGRARVLAHYTHAQVAAATVQVYRNLTLPEP